ncbi:DMT family transporter [Motilibacter aurantiacus]|uniref:DMT family transporter n=1 Tax=Motilibacter aurantiacus TaxID=2714955 RepID=UPI002F2B557A
MSSTEAPARGSRSLASHKPLAAAVAVAAGVLLAVQARVNGQLGDKLDDSIAAALLSFAIGTVIVAALALARRAGRAQFAALPALIRSGRLRWWQCLGGLSGGIFVAVQAHSAPVLGVALYSVAVVAGQTTSSLAVDRLGLGPAGRVRLTGARGVAAAVTVLAVLVAVSDRLDGRSPVGAMVLTALAGVLLAVQQAVNGRVSQATGEPLVAGLVNFLLGTLLLVVAYLGFTGLTSDVWSRLPGEWWLYLGGAFGVVVIVSGAQTVRALGVLLLGLCTVLGQLAGGIVLDLAAPVHDEGVSVWTVVGCLLTAGAIAVAARGSRR